MQTCAKTVALGGCRGGAGSEPEARALRPLTLQKSSFLMLDYSLEYPQGILPCVLSTKTVGPGLSPRLERFAP